MTGYLEQPFFLKNKDYVKFKNLRTRVSKLGENFKNANQSVFVIVLYKRKLRVLKPGNFEYDFKDNSHETKLAARSLK